MKPSQLILVGGGASIRPALSMGLWEKLENHFVFGLNYSYHYFPNPTAQIYVDRTFYEKQSEDLAKMPLVIGKPYHFKKLPNTVFLQACSKYVRDVRKGCYKASLVGIYALSLGVYLLDEGQVFILGYDYGEARKKGYDKSDLRAVEKARIIDKSGKKYLTHFYQDELTHRGTGKINYYNAKDRAKKDFSVYENEKKICIYNVSPDSRIPTFPKIDYSTFFKMLDKSTYNQEELRKWIKEKLK